MEGFASRPVRIQTAVVMSTVLLVRELSGVVLTIVDCKEGDNSPSMVCEVMCTVLHTGSALDSVE